jgi:hypothetical protein
MYKLLVTEGVSSNRLSARMTSALEQTLAATLATLAPKRLAVPEMVPGESSGKREAGVNPALCPQL